MLWPGLTINSSTVTRHSVLGHWGLIQRSDLPLAASVLCSAMSWNHTPRAPFQHCTISHRSEADGGFKKSSTQAKMHTLNTRDGNSAAVCCSVSVSFYAPSPNRKKWKWQIGSWLMTAKTIWRAAAAQRLAPQSVRKIGHVQENVGTASHSSWKLHVN